jgi:hypothetical protein
VNKLIVSFNLDDDATQILKLIEKESGHKSASYIIRSLIKGAQLKYSDRATRTKVYQDLRMLEKDFELLKKHNSEIQEANRCLELVLQEMISTKNNMERDNIKLVEYIKRLELINAAQQQTIKLSTINLPMIAQHPRPRRRIRNRTAHRRRARKSSYPPTIFWGVKLGDAEQSGPDDQKDEAKSSM